MTGMRGTDAWGHPIKELRIAEVDWQGAPLYVLWTMDGDGLWVMPGASRTRQDMRNLGEIVQALGSLWHPDAAQRIADLRSLSDIVDMTEEEQDAIGAELLRRLPSDATAS